MAARQDVTTVTCYAGIDAHKADLHVTVHDEDGEEADHFTVGNDPVAFEGLTDRLDSDDHVGIEACDMAYPIVEHLLRGGIEVQVGHPTKLSYLMDPDYKDDDRNSWHLADLLRVGRFPPSYHPDPNAFLARDVLRRREDLGQQVGDVKRRIKSLIKRYGLEPPVEYPCSKRGLAWLKDAGLGDDRDLMLRHYAEQYELFERQKAQLETELARRAWDVPEARHLVTISPLESSCPVWTRAIIVLWIEYCVDNVTIGAYSFVEYPRTEGRDFRRKQGVVTGILPPRTNCRASQ